MSREIATCLLHWDAGEAGISVWCLQAEKSIPFKSWPLHNPIVPASGKPARLAPILSLAESAPGLDPESSKILLPHSFVASLNADELAGLGLPEPIHFSLEIQTRGLITDTDLRVDYGFIHPSGRPVMGSVRTGSILNVGGENKTITDPLYSIVEAVDRLRVTPPDDSTMRFESLAELQRHLPDGVDVQGSLRNLRIVKADSFSLRPFVNRNGQADFDPVLMRPATLNQGEVIEPECPMLPEAIDQSYARNFRRLGTPQRNQVAGSGWYVVVPEVLRKCLEIVREKQDASESQRRKFISSPLAFFREALQDQFDEATLERLFIENADYSARVKEIGVWQPRVLPFLRKAREPWLPPPELGLKVGDTEIAIEKGQIGDLSDDVRKALATSIPSVKYEGADIPATEETLRALAELATLKDKPLSDVHERQSKDRIALLILDNLESLDFSPDIRPGRSQVGEIPSLLKTQLLQHQVDGFKWLQELWVSGSAGGVLADDMGLGKTLQTLAFLSWVREQERQAGRRPNPVLIVAPTGLLKNWIDEHNKHLDSPGLGEYMEVQGASLRQLRLQDAARGNEMGGGLPVLDVTQMKRYDLVLTSYETLRDYQHSFGRIQWMVMVLDEAQKIKNPATLVCDASKAMNADLTIALTGTPVENRLTDLWSIADAVRPGCLGSLKAFAIKYESGSSSVSDVQELKTSLTETMKPILLLRRMKQDHLKGLPAIQHHPIKASMPEVQAQRYDDAVAAANVTGGFMMVLQAIQQFRTISLHPFRRTVESDQEYINSSARMKVAFDILDSIYSKKQKALVFLDSLEVQGVIAEIIQRRYQSIHPPLIINGAVAGSKRKERVDVFQSRVGFDVMILSPRAGGVGLNLTAANHVIHLDRWWNPAVEDQCTDRVYRIGQEREVHVYLPLAMHPKYADRSFDSRLDRLLEEKRSLSRTVLAPPAPTETDLKSMCNDVIGVPSSTGS